MVIRHPSDTWAMPGGPSPSVRQGMVQARECPARVCLVSRRAGAPAAGNGAQAAEGEEGEAGRLGDRLLGRAGPEPEAVKVHEIRLFMI